MTDKFSCRLLDVKTLGDREFEGYGSVFHNVDLGGDIVMPGAFKKSLAQHTSNGTMPKMFYGHDPNRVPGRWLSIKEDNRGLAVRGVLAKTPLGDEVRELLRMDAIGGLSIGYRTVDWDHDASGNRRIKEVDLWECSVVSLPMNTSATVISAKDRFPTVRHFERALNKEFGFTRRAAAHVATKAWSTVAEQLGATGKFQELIAELDEQTAIVHLLTAAKRIRGI